MTDEWSTLDELLGMEAAAETPTTEEGIGRLAFYGRCSTEDNQDPRTSLSWQSGEAERFIAPLGGEIVAEYFDIGQSRFLPWERREQASRILEELKRPDRGWDGLVVGEATRCWYGNQFSLTWPKFDRYGVALWIPSLGGAFDPQNTAHDMAMTITGGLSKSERQHVQRRVRAAMAAQVLVDGRHQGGRAPYGYRVIDAGPHPNPRKAQEGYRLRVLDVDEEAAPVVRRIFVMFLNGASLRSITDALNVEGIPCPSAHNPRQNRHRRGDGWQHATVKAILDNPRYTGFAVYGRWRKVEELLDPDDVAAGHVVRFRRSSRADVVRSREPAHPVLVSVEDFTRVQLEMRARRGSGRSDQASRDRSGRPTRHAYALRGLIRCAVCDRKMEGAKRDSGIYYRCVSRDLGPAAADDHPTTVYLLERPVLTGIHRWLNDLFKPARLERTIDTLHTAQRSQDAHQVKVKHAHQRRRTARRRVDALLDLAERGVADEVLVQRINSAHAELAAAEQELRDCDSAAPRQFTREEIRTAIVRIGDVHTLIARGEREPLAELYDRLSLKLRYDHRDRTVEVTADPAASVDNVCVRGGT